MTILASSAPRFGRSGKAIQICVHGNWMRRICSGALILINTDTKRISVRFRRMPRRRAFIRPLNKSLVGMMRSPNDLTPPMPWFLVLRPAVGWHLRVPFWQGPQPYSIEPETDAEAMTIFSEYCDRQGFRPTRELA